MNILDNINYTDAFVDGIDYFFKIRRKYSSDDTDHERLVEVLNEILSAYISDDHTFDLAEEYCINEDIENKLHKKYKVFISDKLYLIFILCDECKHDLSCRHLCIKNKNMKIAFVDIWIS